MQNKPLVSVFIPYYNDEEFLRDSIESVLNQTYENFELILLNHASTDSSRDLAHSYKDSRIKHIDMPKNYGAGGGILFEKMLNAATGKYVKPFCADDVLLPNALENLINYMETNPNIDFAFGNVEYIDSDGNDLKQNWFTQRPKFSMKHTEIDLIKLYIEGISMLPYIGSIAKTSVLKPIQYNKTFIMLFDMSIWLSLLCKGCKIGFLDKIISAYRIHSNQVSTPAKEHWVKQMSYYEHSTFWETLFLIEDIELVKQIFDKNKLCEKLRNKKDIPFIIANSLLTKYAPMAYAYLSKLFSNPDYLEYVENEFGWGVRELRTEIGKNSQDLKGFKNKYIYSKQVKELKFWQLAFLCINRIVYILSLKPIKRRLKQGKKYSL